MPTPSAAPGASLASWREAEAPGTQSASYGDLVDSRLVGGGYADHLTDADLGLLVSGPRASPTRPGRRRWLRGRPEHSRG